MLTKRIFTIAFLAMFACGALVAQNFKYIGAVKCGMCHKKDPKGNQLKKWQEGPHASAMKSLSTDQAKKIATEMGIADPTTDAACIKCHSTKGHADAKLAAAIKLTEGVSCESCHGPGSMYKSPSVMKNQKMALTKGLILPTEEVCKKCHNEESPTYKPFNFEEKVAVIAHPDPTQAK